jgi:hypothetical protein
LIRQVSPRRSSAHDANAFFFRFIARRRDNDRELAGGAIAKGGKSSLLALIDATDVLRTLWVI